MEIKKLTLITVAITSLGIGLIAGMEISRSIINKYPYELTNAQKWKNCIEKSQGSDAECQECDYLYNFGLSFDLPEEIMQATEKDTLKAVLKGETIYLTF